MLYGKYWHFHWTCYVWVDSKALYYTSYCMLYFRMIVSMYMSEKFIHLYMACGCIKRECEYVCVCVSMCLCPWYGAFARGARKNLIYVDLFTWINNGKWKKSNRPLLGHVSMSAQKNDIPILCESKKHTAGRLYIKGEERERERARLARDSIPAMNVDIAWMILSAHKWCKRVLGCLTSVCLMSHSKLMAKSFGSILTLSGGIFIHGSCSQAHKPLIQGNLGGFYECVLCQLPFLLWGSAQRVYMCLWVLMYMAWYIMNSFKILTRMLGMCFNQIHLKSLLCFFTLP